MPHSKLTIQKVAEKLVDVSKELSPLEYRLAVERALYDAAPEDIVAITRCLPPELRRLMPRKHLH
jgi:hypothetical protein